MRIVVYQSDSPCLRSSLSVFPIPASPPELALNWLIFGHTTITPSCLKVCWDLPKFTKAVLSLLPESVTAELSRPPHRAKWNGYRLFVAPDKCFSVSRDGQEASIYDLSQYYPDISVEPSLVEQQSLADKLMAVLEELGITNPPSLSSPIALARGSELLGGSSDTIPTIFDTPEADLGAFEVALQCTPREWISAYQLGSFDPLWSADISSAYPYQAAQLMDIRDCTLQRISAGEPFEYAAMRMSHYGFLVGDFTVYPDHPLVFCSPFIADRGDGTLVNFTGTVRNYPCLLDEVRTIYQYGLGEFKLKSGWFINPKPGVHPRYPFRDLMMELYSKRDGTEPRSYILKRIMAGLVGKLLETWKDADGNVVKYGPMWNSVYHALITTRTRLQVFDFLVSNKVTKDELCFVGVDGVKLTRRIDLPRVSGLGQWRSLGSQPTIIFSPGGVISSDRNFKGTSYADFMIQVCDHPNASKYGNHQDIDIRRLFLSQTRVFDKMPRTGNDLLANRYSSSPINFGT